jgi:hypothetical protein
LKQITFILLALFFSTLLHAQSRYLKINAAVPKQLKQGQSFKLKTIVEHNFTMEKTGGINCTFQNASTHKSVDGWFLNIFPFQYFTTIAKTPFETEFTFTVPDEYNGKFEIILVAVADKVKDSVHFTIPVINK